jgi:hypothetical protein
VGRLKDAWKTASHGTGRTVRWVAGGMRDGTRDAGRRTVAALRGDEPPASNEARSVDPDRAADRPSSFLPPAAGATAKAEPDPAARRRRRKIAIAVAASLLVAAWIAWTVVIWDRNGAAAGVGVLVSWPAVFAVLALVALPFAWAMADKRQVDDDGAADETPGSDATGGESFGG